MQISRKVDQHLYPRKAINEARTAFKEYCEFKITPLGEYQLLITVQVRSKYKSQNREIILEFFNFLLDYSAELHFNE